MAATHFKGPIYSNGLEVPTLSADGTSLVSGDGVLLPVVGGLSAENTAAAATANTTIIRAAIAAGSAQIMAPGTYYINDTIWLDEDQSLVTGPGVTLKQFAGSNKLMVGTAPMNATPTAVTITWTAGNKASVAWTAHGLTIGSCFVVQGATEVQWNDVYRVIAVTDADNVVVALAEYRDAGPTGSTTARACVTLGRVDVQLDYNFAENASAVQGVNRHGAVFAFVQDSEIHVRVSDVYKYGGNLAGAINTKMHCHGVRVAEILKKYGPLRNCETYPSGHAVDDCASFQAKEPAGFLAYMPCFGNIKDHREFPGDLVNSAGSASGAIVIYADDDHDIDGIVIEGGSALSDLNGGVTIKSGDGFTPASAKLGKITLRDLTIGCKTATDHSMEVSCYVDVLTLERPRFVPADVSQQALRFESTSRVRVLRIVGWHFNEPLWPGAGASAYLLNLNGAHDVVVLEGCSFRGRAAQARLINVGTNGVQQIILRDCEFENWSQIGIVNDGGSVAPRITMDGVRCNTVGTGFDVRDDAIFVLRNCTFASMASGVIRPTTNARNVLVYDEGGNTFSSASAITCVAPGTAVPYGPLPIDIGATGITKASGASAFNTGTGRGTIPQNRPVVCDGTNWFNATNLSHTF